MANYCLNFLLIKGQISLISEIKNKIITTIDGQPSFSFGTILKSDEESRHNIWGTKTDANDYGALSVVLESDSIFISFDTAWNPPEPVIKKLKEMFPKAEVLLAYAEEGCGFAGEYDGISNNCYDRNVKPEAENYRRVLYTHFKEPDDLEDEDTVLYLQETKTK